MFLAKKLRWNLILSDTFWVTAFDAQLAAVLRVLKRNTCLINFRAEAVLTLCNLRL